MCKKKSFLVNPYFLFLTCFLLAAGGSQTVSGQGRVHGDDGQGGGQRSEQGIVQSSGQVSGAVSGQGSVRGVGQEGGQGAGQEGGDKWGQAVWSSLDRVVGNSSVVAFGESSHRLVGLHAFANDMFRYLAEKKGFRVFVLETMWELENAVDEFVKSDSSEMTFKQSFYLNAFSSDYTVQMIKWVKQWNREHPKDPITIGGYQPEQPVSDCRDIRKYFSGSRLQIPDSTLGILKAELFFNGTFSHDLDAVNYFGKKRRTHQPALRPAERDSLRKALQDVKIFITDHKAELVASTGLDRYEEMRAHLISLKGYLFGLLYYADATNFMCGCGEEEKGAESMTRNIYSEGDHSRMEIFNILRGTRWKNKKIMIWMHAWHAAKHSYLINEEEVHDLPVVGTVSFGTYLSPQLGKDYVVIGSVVPCGTCAYTPSEDAIETKFYKALGQDTVLIDVKKPAPRFAGLPLQENGSLFVQEGACVFRNMNLAQQFDAVLYIPSSKDVR